MINIQSNLSVTNNIGTARFKKIQKSDRRSETYFVKNTYIMTI